MIKDGLSYKYIIGNFKVSSVYQKELLTKYKKYIESVPKSMSHLRK
jgi:hypothetical protein